MSTGTLTKKNKNSQLKGLLLSCFGGFCFAAGVNFFILPLNLYNSGFMGIAQLIRTFIMEAFHLSFGQTDITGIIFFIINLPICFLAYKKVGKSFFAGSIIVIIIQSMSQTLIPVPESPLISDYLTACIVGGVISGGGTGLVLLGGHSGGGQEMLGMYITREFPKISVGMVGLILNIFVYSICLFLFDVEIVIYSLIYGVIFAIVCDKVHMQNINMNVLIFTKQTGVDTIIMERTGRGVTKWEGVGAYTGEKTYILSTVISKYETEQIKQLVLSKDAKAFVIFAECGEVIGNFEKRLVW